MIAVPAGRLRLCRLTAAIGAAIVITGIGGRLLDGITNVAHAARAGLHGRHRDDQGKYENQVFHPFVFKKSSSMTVPNDSGSVGICKKAIRLS